MLTLLSSDGQAFKVDEAVGFECQTIKNMVEDTGGEEPLPLPNVHSKVLAIVIPYLEYHAKRGGLKEDDASKAWDAEFVKVEQAVLFDLILAANYLNTKSLLDLTCAAVASLIKGKTPEEIRSTFNIKNDFTPEEEEEVRRENQWAFD